MTNDERDTMIRETHDTVVALRPLVEAHDKALFGNGQRGAVARLQTVEVRQEECKGRTMAEKGDSRFAATIAVALLAAIAGVCSVIVMLRS